MKITASALIEFFIKGGQYSNQNRIRISMIGKAICLAAKLEEDDDNDHLYELYDEVSNVKEFIEAYDITAMKDLELLKISNIWNRYFSEKAEVIFTDGNGNAIHFKKFRLRTMIYNVNLNYYSEVNKVLNMTDHFKDYIRINRTKLESLSYKN